MKTNPLVALGRAGQSPWIDYIHRGMIASGELARRIAEDGIRGVTSNPTIFEKAVSSGRDYDDQIRALARARTTLLDAYKAIVTDDIRAAADVLRPVYDASRGDDGYVSLEVDPDLARDTKATIARARELFDAVGRPNVMIKIPGTKEGLPAVEETIAAGIPVNVTLIFSVRRYEEVAEAYLRGRRAAYRRRRRSRARSRPSPPSSSPGSTPPSTRSSCPPSSGGPARRRRRPPSPSSGRLAVANARLAYARFLAIIDTPRWRSLALLGARVQRPLWASTGTKNPKYSDVKYVEELIGPDTVNTMPPQTMDAFRDHGAVADTLSGAGADAKAVLDDYALMETGIEEVCARLEEEGVKSFLDSYRKLLAAVEGRLNIASAG